MPAGEPLPDGGTIPASQVSQNVQPDLVQNTMREPFKLRLQLLLNEFGTALAGNGDALNEAIRLGAPALTELEEVTEILAGQNELIRDLNVNSERVSGELARVRDQIVRFVDEAEDVARTALERREDVSRGFDLFDDYVAELGPDAGAARRDRAPADAAPDRPARGGARAAPALGEPAAASSAHPSGRSTPSATPPSSASARCAAAATRSSCWPRPGKQAPVTAEILADFVRDLDDPRRAVEINDLAARDHGPDRRGAGDPQHDGLHGLRGRSSTTPYYQSLAINQFDRGGHTLHIGLQEVFSGPCGAFSSGHDPDHRRARACPTRRPAAPTTDFFEAAALRDLARPEPAGHQRGPRPAPSTTRRSARTARRRTRARVELCDPNDPASAARRPARGRARPAAPRRRPRRRRPRRGARPGRRAPAPGLRSTRTRSATSSRTSSTCPANALDDLGLGGKKGKGKKGLGGLGKGAEHGGRRPPRLPPGAMKRQRATAALAASPTMVGAVTVLIAIVAVFLAYNANKGLPFVPTYRVSVEVPNSARLRESNEIRIGGTRVGRRRVDRAGGRRPPPERATRAGAPASSSPSSLGST